MAIDITLTLYPQPEHAPGQYVVRFGDCESVLLHEDIVGDWLGKSGDAFRGKILKRLRDGQPVCFHVVEDANSG